MGKEAEHIKVCWPVFENGFKSQHDLRLEKGDYIPISASLTRLEIRKAMKRINGQVKRSLELLGTIISEAGDPYGIRLAIDEVDKFHRQIVISSNEEPTFNFGSPNRKKPFEEIWIDLFPKEIIFRVKTRNFYFRNKYFTSDSLNKMFKRMTYAKRADLADTLLQIVVAEALESGELNRRLAVRHNLGKMEARDTEAT